MIVVVIVVVVITTTIVSSRSSGSNNSRSGSSSSSCDRNLSRLETNAGFKDMWTTVRQAWDRGKIPTQAELDDGRMPLCMEDKPSDTAASSSGKRKR